MRPQFQFIHHDAESRREVNTLLGLPTDTWSLGWKITIPPKTQVGNYIVDASPVEFDQFAHTYYQTLAEHAVLVAYELGKESARPWYAKVKGKVQGWLTR